MSRRHDDFLQFKTFLCVFLLILSFQLFAGTTGKITGTITDQESGERLPGVNITLLGTTTGGSTDLAGNYVILNIPPGVYNLQITMMGYQQVLIQKVRVAVDYTTRINRTLSTEILDLGESVTVVAERPIVRMDLTSTSAIIGSEEIAEMPVEDFEDVMATKAGVVKGADNSMHIRGGRSSEIVYMVDGIAVTNAFWGGSLLSVENTAIEELQVISGTFNAEYGQAMSGIVNIVTKEGAANWNFRLSSYIGDYYSTKTEKYLNIDDFDPISFQNLDVALSGPVPLFSKTLSFFSSGRYYQNKGYHFGIREHLPTDLVDRTSAQREDWVIEKSGDGELVAMNPFEKLSWQSKLTWRPWANTKVSYGLLGDDKEYKSFSGMSNFRFRYNPDGDYSNYRQSWNHSLSWTQTVNPKTFFEFKIAYTNDDYRKYVYEDPLDSRYVDDTHYLRTDGQTGFYLNGQGMWHYEQKFKTYIAKFDITSQIRSHEVKAGIEGKYYDLKKHDYKTVMEEWTEWQPTVLDPFDGPNADRYRRKPKEFSIYIQDKIELKDMILRGGIRYEYFDPSTSAPADLEDSNLLMSEERDFYAIKTVKAGVKHQVSPRLGLAFPITDRGAIHFSYGHFFQIPPFAYLYANPEFEVKPGYLQTLMGNPDLNPQHTVIYEIGLQQQLTDNIGMDITGFYKDINNLLSSGLSSGLKYLELPGGTFYSRYANEDYANVRGITLNFTQRRTGYLSWAADYSFLVARGNASSPTTAFYDLRAGQEPTKKVVPLSWDQAHTLNINLTVSVPRNWAVGVLGRIESGLPYTPSPERLRGIGMGQETPETNSDRKPAQYIVDLTARKDFVWKKFTYSLFLKIYNLFDRTNERYVYNDTGRAGYSITAQRLPDNSLENPGIYPVEDYYSRPFYYREPREIRFGFTLDFN